jgi:hypothetical protein
VWTTACRGTGVSSSDLVSHAGGRARVCTKHLLRVELPAGNRASSCSRTEGCALESHSYPYTDPVKGRAQRVRLSQLLVGLGHGAEHGGTPLGVMGRVLGARLGVQSTHRARGVLRWARSRSRPHTSRLRLPCARNGLSPRVVQLGARLPQPAPSIHAGHRAFFGSNASRRRSMK